MSIPKLRVINNEHPPMVMPEKKGFDERFAREYISALEEEIEELQGKVREVEQSGKASRREAERLREKMQRVEQGLYEMVITSVPDITSGEKEHWLVQARRLLDEEG